ncbi:hypothetical protein CC2G_011605 [Coprinopsis cinerea AmutBmut pab1-1]|nr:hypothetical protein CC2G_011605 [Coprinopsis cinerea AmutBmut pab1-1]
MSLSDLPDRPLVVKCTFDKANKKITFNSARNCSFNVLKEKVEKCFSLRSSIISWRDDDGETSQIVSDPDLAEAVQYFCSGDDSAPLSSAASILSGRSFGSRKITLRVTITVDYDGPSLSDTSSLASLEEYRGYSGKHSEYSVIGRSEASFDLEDDAVTVSSRDPTGSVASHSRFQRPLRQDPKSSPTIAYHSKTNDVDSDWQLSLSDISSARDYPSTSHDSIAPSDADLASARDRYPADPSAVFARLKLQEELGDDSDWESIRGEDRGARWLREQKERAIRTRLGALPEPSISESGSFDDLSGDLSLERNDSGRYYYTYNASASGSQTHASTDEDGFHPVSEADEVLSLANGKHPMKPRPTSRHLNWLVEQRIETEEHRKLQSSASQSSLAQSPPTISPYLDDNLRLYAHLTSPPPEILTDCSMCGTLIDSIRYVCSICGEKPPATVRNQRNALQNQQQTDRSIYTYPPQQHHSHLGSSPQSSSSSSSQVYIGSAETVYANPNNKNLTPPSASGNPFGSSSTLSSRTYINPPKEGYELCHQCFQEHGIHHAVEATLSNSPSWSSSSSVSSPGGPLPVDPSTWRRTAPKKGELRHAFFEKCWGDFGWEDIAQDEEVVSKCKTCSAVTTWQRYKCAACPDFHLCRACYSQVHDIHPRDAFILVPDAPTKTTELEVTSGSHIDATEDSLEHPGVTCAHCLLPIVGARFHCAICDSVDICSNCEAAGLPGNLDAAEGGHNSSHILIKIPIPLEGRELRNASRRALRLWHGRDADIAFSASRALPKAETAYAQTVIGGPTTTTEYMDHKVPCSNCNQSIRGVRYQCAHCPSLPSAYNLCATCEAKSWAIHDPMHIFFKVPRPTDSNALESTSPFLPPLYQYPAGPSNPSRVDDPRAYLRSLYHKFAVCDRCMSPIEGEWFRCANCSIDLCTHCETVDTHADGHVFIVIKSIIDLQSFKSFTNPDNPTPIVLSPVYL